MTLNWRVTNSEQVISVCEGHALTLTNWGKIVLGLKALKKAGEGSVLIVDLNKKKYQFCFDKNLTETKVWNEVKNDAPSQNL